jgi:hypothetical protein
LIFKQLLELNSLPDTELIDLLKAGNEAAFTVVFDNGPLTSFKGSRPGNHRRGEKIFKDHPPGNYVITTYAGKWKQRY